MSAQSFSAAMGRLRGLCRRGARKALHVSRPLLQRVLSPSRRALLGLARRNPWLHARLRRFRLLDYRLRVLVGQVAAAPATPPATAAATAVPTTASAPRLQPGHNQALKSPLESWLNP